MAYAKYLAIHTTKETLENMRRAGTWKQKSNEADVVEVFMSKTVYHRNPAKIFPSVPLHPLMEKWLLNTDDAPTTFDMWKGKKQTYDNLWAILKAHVGEKSNSSPNKKGKKRQDDSSPHHSSKGTKRQEDLASDSAEEVARRRGKAKKTGGNSKKGSSSKSHD